MSEHCGFKPFQDCNCGTECKSATARNTEINQKIATIRAKRNADTALMMVSVAVCFGLFAFSFIHFAVPESQRLARVHQEQVVSR